MSALGQKQTSRPEISMSALPPKADIVQHGGNVRFGPKAAVSRCSKNPPPKASFNLVGALVNWLRIFGIDLPSEVF